MEVRWFGDADGGLAAEPFCLGGFLLLGGAAASFRRFASTGGTSLAASIAAASIAGWRLALPYAIALFLLMMIATNEVTSYLAGYRRPAIVGGVALIAAILVRQGAAIREAQRTTRRLAGEIDRDPLTGLPLRRTAYGALTAALAVAATDRRPVAAAMIDVDDFKRINDRWGHPAGDAVLRLLAASLTRSCGATDVAARLGGDEFLLVLPGVDGATAITVAGRVTADLDGPQPILHRLMPGSTERPTLSIGIAVTRSGEGTAPWLVAVADAAMYDVKRGGKNGVAIVDADSTDATEPSGSASPRQAVRPARRTRP